MFYESHEYLDFYWGKGEEFELNDHLDNAELTALAKAYCVEMNVVEGESGYIRQDGYVFVEEADQEDDLFD